MTTPDQQKFEQPYDRNSHGGRVATLDDLVPTRETLDNLPEASFPFLRAAQHLLGENVDPKPEITTKNGIDSTRATFHIATVEQRPDLEKPHKLACLQYLLYRWFEIAN